MILHIYSTAQHCLGFVYTIQVDGDDHYISFVNSISGLFSRDLSDDSDEEWNTPLSQSVGKTPSSSRGRGKKARQSSEEK